MVIASGYIVKTLATYFNSDQAIDVGDELINLLNPTASQVALNAAGIAIKALALSFSGHQLFCGKDVIVGIFNSKIRLCELTQPGIALAALAREMSIDNRLILAEFLVNSLIRQSGTSESVTFSRLSCVDEIREFMLQRFEELLFHDGKHVFQVADESKVASTPSDAPKP